MFNIEWADSADMIFANSTCFDPAMMEQIYTLSLRCKKGTWMITSSKQLPHSEKINKGAKAPNYELIQSRSMAVIPTTGELEPGPTLHWEFVTSIRL